MSEHLRRVGERIKDNKAETVCLGLAAAALTWEAIAPDKSKDLISHAADRHQGVTAVTTFVLGMHLTNMWERLGLEDFDVISRIGKRFGVSEAGDA